MENSTGFRRSERDFPAFFWHTSIPFLRKCPGFYLAKCGDYQAACAIVKKCANQQLIGQIRQKYPDAVLLPVMNSSKLPLALAQAIGMEICTKPYMHPGSRRRWVHNAERILYSAEYANAASRRYILVDDIVDGGSSISLLQSHVSACGGTVVAVVALALSFDGEAKMPLLSKYHVMADDDCRIGVSEASEYFIHLASA